MSDQYWQAPPLLASALIRRTTALSRAVALFKDRDPGVIMSGAMVPKMGPIFSQYERDAAGKIIRGKPTCVGCSFTSVINGEPGPRYSFDQAWADALWAWARDHDGDDANNADPNAGTYPFAAARHLRRDLRLVKEVGYAWTEREARIWNLDVPDGHPARPVLFGTHWYEGFDTLTPAGFVTLSGKVRGEHEFVGMFADQKRKAWLCRNSWLGYTPYDAHGQNFFVPFATMRKLMRRGGTATLLTKSVKFFLT
jgi:hypothetical protein